jgi:hypothetical protein
MQRESHQHATHSGTHRHAVRQSLAQGLACIQCPPVARGVPMCKGSHTNTQHTHTHLFVFFTQVLTAMQSGSVLRRACLLGLLAQNFVSSSLSMYSQFTWGGQKKGKAKRRGEGGRKHGCQVAHIREVLCGTQSPMRATKYTAGCTSQPFYCPCPLTSPQTDTYRRVHATRYILN